MVSIKSGSNTETDDESSTETYSIEYPASFLDVKIVHPSNDDGTTDMVTINAGESNAKSSNTDSDDDSSSLFSADKSDEATVESDISNLPNDTLEGGLPNAILDIVEGHYEDEDGDTVDITSRYQIVRYIKGGNQSHTYDEEIFGYKKFGEGYLLKVEWEGIKYTYLYKGDNEKHLYLGTEDRWDPNLDPYKYNDIQVYVKTGTNTESSENISLEPEYHIGLCELTKKDGYYYIFPQSKSDTLYRGDDNTGKTFSEGLRIAKNAKVGIATSVKFVTNQYGTDDAHFTYEYRDFYDAVNELYNNKHWLTSDINPGFHAFAFEVDGYVMENTIGLSLNERGEIELLVDYYHP